MRQGFSELSPLEIELGAKAIPAKTSCKQIATIDETTSMVNPVFAQILPAKFRRFLQPQSSGPIPAGIWRQLNFVPLSTCCTVAGTAVTGACPAPASAVSRWTGSMGDGFATQAPISTRDQQA